MKHETITRSRAIALLLAAVALPATPAFAQDVAPLPSPAPVITPTPAPVATVPVTPPAVVRTTPTPVPTPAPPVVQAAPEPEAAAPPPERRASRPTARPRPEARRAAPAAAAAPLAVTPIAEAPVAPAIEPAPIAEPIAPPLAEAPAAPVDEAAPAPESGGIGWLPLVGGLAVLAALIGFFLLRRRRRLAEEEYYEPVYEEAYVEPTPEPAVTPVVEAAPARPLFVDPALAGASLKPTFEPATPAASVIADEAAPVAPVAEAERPWIELSMRPVRAGTSDDDAVVEFELTVQNAGNVPADGVKVSTWMFSADPTQSDAEHILIDPPADARLAELHLEPGDGKQMEATLALPKHDLNVVSSQHRAAFRPVVVADARYPLPDGGEGRISASFEIGVQSDNGELAPLFVDGAPDLREDIEARLHGELERA